MMFMFEGGFLVSIVMMWLLVYLQATLQSKVFKHQLELGHNQEAFTAMMANPDPSCRKDCLRQLIVVLSERGELQALVEFPYKVLEDEVCTLKNK